MIDTVFHSNFSQDTLLVSETIKALAEYSKPSLLEWFSNPNTLIAVTAILISIFSLIFSTIHNRKTFKITKRHNILSVKPLLKIAKSIKGNDGIIDYFLENQGLGPAIIKSLEYRYEDEHFNNIKEFFETIGKRMRTKTEMKVDLDYKEKIEHSVISANTEMQLLQVVVKPPIYTDSLGDLMEKIEILIDYEDMYDNKYSNR